jgi:hypothetical protein
MNFTCNIDVPRTDDSTGIPTSWARDEAISHEARGLLMLLLWLTRPGLEVDEDEVAPHRQPDEPHLRMVTGELAHNGYLEWRGSTLDRRGPRYELVHPERLGPLG